MYYCLHDEVFLYKQITAKIRYRKKASKLFDRFLNTALEAATYPLLTETATGQCSIKRCS